MIAPFWKTIELLEKKQNSLLTTIAVCSLCAAIMLTVGIYKGEARAEATIASEGQIVTALKPITQSADQYSDAIGSVEEVADMSRLNEADWELIQAVRRLLGRRSLVASESPHTEASDQELLTALIPLLVYSESLRLHIREQDAPQESKDANSKDVGDSR